MSDKLNPRMGGNMEGKIATPDKLNKTALPGADSEPIYVITDFNPWALAAIPLPIWQETIANWANCPCLPIRNFYV